MESLCSGVRLLHVRSHGECQPLCVGGIKGLSLLNPQASQLEVEASGWICQSRRQGQISRPFGDCYQEHNHILLYQWQLGTSLSFLPLVSKNCYWIVFCYLSNNSSSVKVFQGTYVKLQPWLSLLSSLLDSHMVFGLYAVGEEVYVPFVCRIVMIVGPALGREFNISTFKQSNSMQRFQLTFSYAFLLETH